MIDYLYPTKNRLFNKISFKKIVNLSDSFKDLEKISTDWALSTDISISFAFVSIWKER